MAASDAGTTRMRVLVVDDDADLAPRVRASFRGAEVVDFMRGAQIGTARDRALAFEGLSSLRASFGPDIAIVDLRPVDAPAHRRAVGATCAYLRKALAELPLLWVVRQDVAAAVERDLAKQHSADFVLASVLSDTAMQELTLRARVLLGRTAELASRSASCRPGVTVLPGTEPGEAAAGPMAHRTAAQPSVETQTVRGVVDSLHDPASGRLDARRVGDLFGLQLSAVAGVLGRNLSTVSKTPNAKPLQHGLSQFERIGAAFLHMIPSAERMRMWMNAAHPDLGGRTPISFIEERRGDVVVRLIESVLNGQPG
jgi:hypothetical protein